jgi:hypothetical protein
MITREELEVWSAAMVAAERLNIEDAFQRVAHWQATKLRAAVVSRERFRGALEALVARPAPMVTTVTPALGMWAWLAGAQDPPAAAQAEAERLINEHVDETRRQIRPLLDGWPGNDAAPAVLDKILGRWRERAPRIAERLARALEGTE